MNQEEFEKLIISFVQGDLSSHSSDIMDQMFRQKENLHDFINSLFNLFFMTKNEMARKSSMVLLAFVFTKKSLHEIFDDKWIENFITKLITFYKENSFILHKEVNNKIINEEIIDNEMIYLFTQLVGNFAQNIHKYSIINQFVSNSDVKTQEEPNSTVDLTYIKDLTFQISSIYSLFTTINFSNIESHYQVVLDILKRALESYDQNFENAIKSITILSSLLDFYPDEMESTKDHIDIIISIADKSETLPPSSFLNLWKSICGFLHSSAASNDKALVTRFHPSIFKVCSLDSIPSEFKLYPLRSIWSCACDYDRPVVHQIIALTVKIASEYVTQSHSLPYDFLFMFESCFHSFEHDMIYQYSRQLIVASLASENPSDRIVGLCLIRYMVQNVPHEVFHDTDSIIEAVKNGLQSEDELTIEAACIIISSCSVSISSNLIDVDSLLPQLIPLIIHSNPDIRYHSTEACLTLLSFSRPQIMHGISLMVFNLISKVPMEDIFRFLTFLSKCISHDVQLETELAVHFANFTLSLMKLDPTSNDFNQSIIEGSCHVSIALMSINENTHQILLPQTIEIISTTLQFNEQFVKNFGISMLNKLMKIFPNEGSQLFNTYSSFIEPSLNLDIDDNSVERRSSIINISSIVSLNNDGNHPFIPKIIEIAMNWINSGHQSLIGSGIEALKKLQCHPILQKDIIIKIFQSIASVLTQTNSFDVACSCATAMAYCVKHCTASAEAHDEIAKIGYHCGLSYIKGDMLVLLGVSPIGTDLEFNLIYSMSMLVCELFSTPCNLMRYFYPFMESIISRNNNLNTEVMMTCLISALKNDALIEEEIEKTKAFTLSLFIDHIPQELMCTEIELIGAMLDKGFLTKEDFNETKINTIKVWWDICNSPQTRKKLKAALAGIALLLWKLQASFQIMSMLKEIMIDSFKQFPPDDISFTPDMINVADKCMEIDTEAPEIILLNFSKGLMKIMASSKMVLKKRGINDELYNKCKKLLTLCLERSSKIQPLLNNFANKYESRKQIFQEFIH